ncbi:hypothetical protein BDV26DRAFT_256352 [Aspergillus bertholletiae]|uniref:Uncharacterized protein n=1 Tax=Aspergillus bertholletiae TaxID=1226010 RepID=A0A5N7BH32_9EURO|nr:hypothetical protein BDV26DRAFT_256352 [Aspergillus bertholletiae]
MHVYHLISFLISIRCTAFVGALILLPKVSLCLILLFLCGEVNVLTNVGDEQV